MAPSTDVKALACQDINNDTLVHPHDSCDQHFVDKRGKSGYRPQFEQSDAEGYTSAMCLLQCIFIVAQKTFRTCLIQSALAVQSLTPTVTTAVMIIISSSAAAEAFDLESASTTFS
jgi:hypothetical protein